MKTIHVIALSFATGAAGAILALTLHHHQPAGREIAATVSNELPTQPIMPPGVQPPAAAIAGMVVPKSDFTVAAARSIPSVVYINSISKSGLSYSIYDMLFGNGGQQTQVSSGSGVIYSADGYIVTNNHVIEQAEQIEVLYNKKVYVAELVGTDPSTDLAVLKIQETSLPAITLGNSASLGVGEWVVAVGNPFSLTSTVTVGIVSAKGRSINVVSDKFPIESFIQTDAAINPGNSGGALVNSDGHLVGINTAILSRTGSYTGYAFAVPVDIVKKVVNDLIKYGVLQKAMIGCEVVEYDARNAERFRLSTDVRDFKGVLVAKVADTGAAHDAGLRPGDIITQIGEVQVNSRSAFEEELSYHSPGDNVSITYRRGEDARSANVTLLNKFGEKTAVKRKIYSNNTIGSNLEAVDAGVKVFKIKDGLFRKIGIPENYTIISINRKRIRDPQEVIEFFEKYKGRVLLYGMNSSRQEFPLQFFLQ